MTEWKKRCKDAGCQKSVTGKCVGCYERRVQLHPEKEMCIVCLMGDENAPRDEPFVAHTTACIRFGQ